ncbi:MAG: SAVED domain-containing protein [Sarcina sp.]
MYKLYMKLGKVSANISYKLIISSMTITSAITFMLLIPEITVALGEVLEKLNNDGVKNIISVCTDFNLLITEVIKIDKLFIIFSTISIGIFSIILLIIKCTFKNKELIEKVIIGHSSMSKMQFLADTESGYRVKEINLVDSMKDINMNYDKIKYAINTQDRFIEDFKHNIDSDYDYGYMGIAHTPLIFRVGSQIGDEITIKLFHKYRTGDNKKFKELNTEANFKAIQIENTDLNKNSNELIVGLATTFPIKLDELKVLKHDSKNVIIFKSEELGYDVITSAKQVEAYVKYIMDKIREIVKEKNIAKIHIVLATSVAMTFALGRAISRHHDPEIIIYHFDLKNSRKYTWGIDVFKEYNECLIITKDSNCVS